MSLIVTHVSIVASFLFISGITIKLTRTMTNMYLQIKIRRFSLFFYLTNFMLKNYFCYFSSKVYVVTTHLNRVVNKENREKMFGTFDTCESVSGMKWVKYCKYGHVFSIIVRYNNTIFSGDNNLLMFAVYTLSVPWIMCVCAY